MKYFFMYFVLLNSLILSQSFAETAYDLVEKSGDDALPKLKTMSSRELAQKDKDGKTAFYWAIYHGHKKTVKFLQEKLKKDELVSDRMGTELYSNCSNSPSCPSENISLLARLGFKISEDAVAASVTGTQECSLQKFDLLMKLKAPFNGMDKNGFNILHQIVDRSRMGRPILSRECLVMAIRHVTELRSELKRQKNSNGLTPLQMALNFQKTKDWGSGITSEHLDPIIQSLK